MTSNTPMTHASSPSLAASGRPEHAASAGFTLIEIIMCLVLLAILASAAFSSLSMPNGTKADAEATLRSMLANIAHARSLSIMQPGVPIPIDLSGLPTCSELPTFRDGIPSKTATCPDTATGTDRKITIYDSGYAAITD